MIANNLTQLFGILIQVVTVVFGAYKGWQAWLENEIKKSDIKSKEIIELAKVEVEKIKAEVELAKHNSLTAVQVTEIVNHYQNVKREIEELKTSTKIKDAEFLHALGKLEELLDELSQNFTQFLINKAK